MQVAKTSVVLIRCVLISISSFLLSTLRFNQLLFVLDIGCEIGIIGYPVSMAIFTP